MAKKSKTLNGGALTKAKSKTKTAEASDGQTLAITPKDETAPTPTVVDELTKAPKAAKAPKEARTSPTSSIRQMLAADFAIEPTAIKEALAKQGIHPPVTTISTVRADFPGCLRALQAAGRVVGA